MAILLVCSSTACGGGGLPTGASPVAANVEFHYEATREQRAERYECDGVARIYPSWWGFTHATMISSGEARWTALFENVPVGPQSVRVEPPPGCETPGLVANAVRLTADEDLVFAFTVHPDGSVTP